MSSPKRPGPDSIESAIVSIRRLVRVLRINAQRTQSAAGISGAQLFVLEQLGDGTGLSLNDLAARTLTDRSSVADVVDRLVAQRLVDRTVDPTDRRRAAVRITGAGRRMLARAPEAPTTALIAAVRALAPRDRTALARSLAQLNHALGAADEPATMLFVDDATTSPATKRRAMKRRAR
jgi:DNA-binding MarR family transcriptional regulator